MYRILVRSNNILHSINMTTGVSIARTPNRLNSMNEDIRTRGLYLPTVAVVVGDADGGDRTRSTSKSLMLKSSSKSSMRGGGRARSS